MKISQLPTTYILMLLAKLKQKLLFLLNLPSMEAACWSYLKIEEAQVLLREIKVENVLQE
jgi:hypothetical protein